MSYQDRFRDHSEDTKAQAEIQLEKLKRSKRRRRIKRELVDLEIENLGDAEELKTSMRVRGTEAWAPLQPGSVKLVKRPMPIMPDEISHHA